jgi:CheY-like chemotaxis protein
MDQRANPGETSGADDGAARLRALVVDDNATNRLVMQTILSELGCDVGLACDGVEGVQAAAATSFDLVVMDRNMPRQNGDEAARLIRALPSPSRSAFIVRWTTDPPNAAADSDYDGSLDKPVSFSAVISLLERAAARLMSDAQAHSLSRSA